MLHRYWSVEQCAAWARVTAIDCIDIFWDVIIVSLQ